MKNCFFISLILTIFVSCGSYKSKQQIAAISFPELVSIIKDNNNLLYTETEQIGFPKLLKPLKIKVKPLPFTKSTFAKYSKYLEQVGRTNTLVFVDSLPIKPSFVRLQIVDKIGLTGLLNAENNKEINNYLQTDPDYEIVTSIDVVVPEYTMEELNSALTVQLVQDQYKNNHLLLLTGKVKKTLHFNALEVFDFNSSSFCWGEDIYHHKRIKTILSNNENCSANTYKRANQLRTDRTYLKF